MNLTAIRRTAFGGYVKLVRLPFDAAVTLLPGGKTGPRAGFRVTLDRVEAAARSVAGLAFGDDELRADAGRRRAAADERGRALRLRREADRTVDRTAERVEERERTAAERRQEARQRAGAKRQRASKAAGERKRRAQRSASSRRSANRRAAANEKEAVAERGKRARLDALESESEALREREEALRASDEARRLGEAAAAAKSARKRR